MLTNNKLKKEEMLRRKKRYVTKDDARIHVLHLIVGPMIFIVFFAIVFLLAVLLSSCSSDALQEGAVRQGSAIAFGLSDDDATRAAQGTTDLAALRTQGFGVFACHTGLHPYISTSTTPNLMYNQQVGYDDVNGVWTYSPLVYWPNGDDGADEFVTFFAYGPHSTSAAGCIADMSRDDEAGDPWLLYQLGGTESDWQTSQVDLVYDFRRDQVRSGVSTRVNFSFKHALACAGDTITVVPGPRLQSLLQRAAAAQGRTVTATVTSVTLDYLLTRKGRLVLNSVGQPNWQTVESEDPMVHRLFTLTPAHTLASATSSACTVYPYETSGHGVFYIPIETTGGSGQQVSVTVGYALSTGDAGELSATIDLSRISDAGEGRNLRLNVEVPEPECLGRALADAEVGQVLCSHGRAHAAGALACSGQAVALVAYVGDGDSGDYSHGLALALHDAASGTAWCTQTAAVCLDAQYNSYSTAITDLAGLSANATLAATADHEAALLAAAYQYDGSVAAGAHPTGTSQWFLPAMGQWNLMVKALCGDHGDLTSSSNIYYQSAAFSTPITAAGGSAVASGHYWSATEKTAHDAWYISFQRGLTQGGDKDAGKYVRAVLAF